MDCATQLISVIAAECNNPAVAGTYGDVILIPHSAVDRVASTVTDNVISALVLKALSQPGRVFETLDNSVLGAVSLNQGTYQNNFQHDVTLRIFIKNDGVKTFLNGFANTRVIAIVKNKEQGTAGEVTYEAYGYDAGLVLNSVTADTSMADGVVYELVTGSDDTAKEKSLPKSVWTGTLADTETMLASITQ